VTERLSSPVVTSEDLLRQAEFGGWRNDSIQTAQPAVSWLRVIQVMGAVAVIASSCTLAKDPWTIDPRTEVATSPTIRSIQRPKLTAKEARTLALSILQAAEESRARFAEEEATRGISWEEQL
jgi:hypothetical protein